MLTIDSFPDCYIIAAVGILIISMLSGMHVLYINWRIAIWEDFRLEWLSKPAHIMLYMLHAESMT